MTINNKNTIIRSTEEANHLVVLGAGIGINAKQAVRDQIAADTQDFLDRGGEIETLPSYCYELEAHACKMQRKEQRKKSMAELDKELDALMSSVNAGL